MSQALARSTQRTYAYAMTLMDRFGRETGLAFPFDPLTMALFVTFLSRSYKHSSVQTYVSGVVFFHKICGYTDPGMSYLVRKTLAGLKRVQLPSDVRLPITISLLRKLVLIGLPQVCLSVDEQVLFRAMFAVAFFGLLRVGEIMVASAHQRHTLQFAHLKYSAQHGGYVLQFASYKCSQGRSAAVLLRCHEDSAVCAVCALRAYLAPYYDIYSIFKPCMYHGYIR